jgi:putative membrane protein
MSSSRLLSLAIRWVVLAIGVWAAAELLSGIHLEGWESTFLVALILGLLNLYLRPILVLLALPVTILTLGLFIIVINAALLGLTSWIAGQIDSIHFAVDGFGDALLGALIISAISLLIGIFVKPDRIASGLTGGY